MLRDLTYAEAVEKREHLIAIGMTDVSLWKEPDDRLWPKVVRVTEGGTHRLSGPVSARFYAEDAGLTFTWSVDFEQQDANGRGVALFDRDRLRDVVRRLPSDARGQFAAMLREKVLPGLKKRTAEIREALNSQQDSEDCVAGLISFAEV